MLNIKYKTIDVKNIRNEMKRNRNEKCKILKIKTLEIKRE